MNEQSSSKSSIQSYIINTNEMLTFIDLPKVTNEWTKGCLQFVQQFPGIATLVSRGL